MTEQKTNTKDDYCNECGALVPAGTGVLWWQAGPDDGGDVVGRTPAGWRVSHRDDNDCKAEHERRRAARKAEIAAAAAKRAEAEALIAARRDEAEAPALALIVELALVQVPERCNLCKTSLPEVYSATYSDGPGFSGERGVTIRRDGDSAIVTFRSAGFATQHASAAIVERGLATFRVQQWFREGSYNPKDYPGPAVPREALSAGELAEVERLEALKVDAERAEQERLSIIYAERVGREATSRLSKLVAKTGATFSVKMNGLKDAEVSVAIPSQHWTRGALRAPIARLLPADLTDYDTRIRFVPREV